VGAGEICDRLAAGARRASSSAPVAVGGRGDADGGRSSRRPIRAATKAARAPRGALPPWRRGKSGAATPSAWGRAAPGGRRRRRQRRGASAGAALGHGGAVARFSVLCGGAAGSRLPQWAGVLPEGRGAAPSSSSAYGWRCSPTSPGASPSSVSDAVGRGGCATAWPFFLGFGDPVGRPVFGGSPVPLSCASMRWERSPSCGADAAVSDGGDVVLRHRRCTRGCGRWCSDAGWSVVGRLCGVPLLRVSACGARVRVSSSDCPVLTAGRVNPDWVVSCIGGNYLHRRYLAARDRAN